MRNGPVDHEGKLWILSLVSPCSPVSLLPEVLGPSGPNSLSRMGNSKKVMRMLGRERIPSRVAEETVDVNCYR